MITGSCLCGRVRYRAEHAAGPLAHCHCRMCQRAHGSAFSTVLPARREGFVVESGEELLVAYASSPGKQRWFCGTCGSQLFSTRDANATVVLRAGCIDAAPEGRPAAHGWVASRAPWYQIQDDLPRFETGFPGAPPGVPPEADER